MRAVEGPASPVVGKLVPEEIGRKVGRRDPQALLLGSGWFVSGVFHLPCDRLSCG